MPKYLVCLLWLALLWPAISRGAAPASGQLSVQGKALAQITRAVSVPSGMVVEETLVSVGTVVEKNTPLLRYSLLPQDARACQSQLSGKQGALLAARQQLAALEQESLNARNAWQRDRQLTAQGLAPQVESQRSASALRTLAARKTQLQAQLKAHEREYDLLLAELNSYFGSALKRGDPLPARFVLPAPMPGTVIWLAGAARPGGFLGPHAAALTIAALNPIQAEVQVHESEVGRLRKGDTISVEVPNLDNRRFTGRIVSLSWAANDMAIAMPSFYTITIDIENTDNVIRPGYKVQAHKTVQ